MALTRLAHAIGRAVLLLVWVVDWAGSVLLHARHPVSRWRVAHFAVGDRRPVLVVPGLFESWHVMEPLARAMSARGHPVHIVSALGNNLRPIAPSAAMLQRYVRRADLRDVVIVAHSKGGLIGKHMMALDDREGRLAHLVTVNTPFTGSPLARYAPGPRLREFRASSRLLAVLRRERRVNERITYLVSRFDLHVPRSSNLPGAHRIDLDTVGHFRPLRQPHVIALIADLVERIPSVGR